MGLALYNFLITCSTGWSTNVATLTSNEGNCPCIRTKRIKIGGDVCWSILNEANKWSSEKSRVIVLVRRVVINKWENGFYGQRTCIHCSTLLLNNVVPKSTKFVSNRKSGEISTKQVHNHAINKKIRRNGQCVSASVPPRQVGVAFAAVCHCMPTKWGRTFRTCFMMYLFPNTLLRMYRLFFRYMGCNICGSPCSIQLIFHKINDN